VGRASCLAAALAKPDVSAEALAKADAARGFDLLLEGRARLTFAPPQAGG